MRRGEDESVRDECGAAERACVVCCGHLGPDHGHQPGVFVGVGVAPAHDASVEGLGVETAAWKERKR